MMLTPALLVLGSRQYSAAIAFTLALFSHLINHVNIRLQAELEEGENPVSAFQSDGTGSRLRKVIGKFAWVLGGYGGKFISSGRWCETACSSLRALGFSILLP